jgi:hypothetical protein
MMKHDIEELHETEEQAKKNGEVLKDIFGYTYKVEKLPSGQWKLIAHTDQNIMG